MKKYRSVLSFGISVSRIFRAADGKAINYKID